MKTKLHFHVLFLIVLCASNFARAQGSAFTYQGRLNDNGAPANGVYDLRFTLYDLASSGSQVGPIQVIPATGVTNGLFNVTLDFIGNSFSGANRFLEIAVRTNGGSSFVPLNPRQPLTPSPYAIFAGTASNVVSGSAVKSLNTLKDDITLAAGTNVTITPSGNTLTIASAGAGGSGIWNLNGANTYYTAGAVGIGTSSPTAGVELEVNGTARIDPGGSGGYVSFGPASGETGMSIIGANRADVRFDGSTLKLLAGVGTSAPGGGIAVNTLGNVGIGTVSPAHRLSLIGGPFWTTFDWTGALELGNASAIGWRANAAGNRFGIGQTTGGLYFFSTTSDPGTTASPANYDLILTDSGNLSQPRNKGGVVKAMIYVNADGTIARCYNGITDSSSGGCGFTITRPIVGNHQIYRIDFGFQVNDRFVSVTPVGAGANLAANVGFGDASQTANQVDVNPFLTDVSYDGSGASVPFMIFVY